MKDLEEKMDSEKKYCLKKAYEAGEKKLNFEEFVKNHEKKSINHTRILDRLSEVLCRIFFYQVKNLNVDKELYYDEIYCKLAFKEYLSDRFYCRYMETSHIAAITLYNEFGIVGEFTEIFFKRSDFDDPKFCKKLFRGEIEIKATSFNFDGKQKKGDLKQTVKIKLPIVYKIGEEAKKDFETFWRKEL